MNEIQNSIFETMRMFSNDSITKSDATLTVKCRVEEIVDAGLGIYKVSYLENHFSATSNGNIKYTIGEVVYVLIPDGDFSKEKFILGSVSPSVSVQVGDSQNYYDVSDNFIINQNLIELSSYNTSSNIISLTKEDSQVLMEYLKEYRTLSFGYTIKTKLAETQIGGQYGMNINIPLLAEAEDGSGLKSVIKTYSLDTSNILGTPYSIKDWSPQSIYFAIDDQYQLNENQVITIEYFCEDFPQNNEIDIKDIFFKDLVLKVVEQYTEEDYIGYKLTLKASGGNYFLKGSADTKVITPFLKINGLETAFNTYPCYWFIEDASVKPGHNDYLSYGGSGWRCINDKVNVINNEDGTQTFNYVTNSYKLEQKVSSIVYDTQIKCVILYNNYIVSDTITLKNLTSTVDIDLFATNGNNVFIKNAGYVDLTIRFYEEGYTSLEENKPNVKYLWVRYDRNGKLIKDTSDFFNVVSYNLIKVINGSSYFESRVKFPVNEVEDFNNVYCSVYKNVEDKDVLIGTKRILISVSDAWDYKLVVNNGNKIYKYDADGDSPRLDAYDGPLSSKVNEIAPLSYQIFKLDGTELTEDEYLQCKYTWSIPVDSMFKINLENFEDKDEIKIEIKDGYYIITGSGNKNQIPYDIARRFDKSKADSNILLQVDFLGNLLDNIINIYFLKDGASGTNGTKFSAVPVMVEPNGNTYPYGARAGSFGYIQKLHYIYNTNSQKWFWHDTRDNIVKDIAFSLPIGVVVYEDGEILNEDDYIVKYTMFDPKVTTPCFEVTTTDSYQTNLKVAKTPILNEVYCNIIQAKVTIKREGSASAAAADTVIYTYYPIELTLTNIEGNMNIVPTLDGGFSEVLYAADGTNPQWDETYPFSCSENVIGENIRKYYSFDWDYQYHLHEGYGNTEESKKRGSLILQPSSKYDDGSSKNYVKAKIAFDEDLEEKLREDREENTKQIESFENAIFNSDDIYNSVLAAEELYKQYNFTKKINNIKDFLDKRNQLSIAINSIGENIGFFEEYISSVHPRVFSNCPILETELTILKYYLSEAKEAVIAISSYDDIIDLNEYKIKFKALENQYCLNDLPRGVASLIDTYIKDINNAVSSYQKYYNQFINLSSIPLIDFKNILKQLNEVYEVIDNRASIRENIKEYYLDTLLITIPRDKLVEKIKRIYSEEIAAYLKSNNFSEEKKIWQKEIDVLTKNNQDIDKILATKGQELIHIRPIVLLFNRYEMSNLNNWDGNKIYVDEKNEEYILAPQMGAGKKEDDNSFTGIVMGLRNTTQANTQTGLFGYHKGQQSIFLNAENGSAIFGKVNQGGQIIIDPINTTALLYSSSYYKNYNKETGLPTSYTQMNENGEGMLIDLSTPAIKWGNGNFSVNETGRIVSKGGGIIQSANWDEETSAGNFFNFDNGNFSLANQSIVFKDNKLNLQNIEIEWSSSTPPEISDIEGLEGYLDQLDGRIQSFSQTDDPSEDWTTTEVKIKHKGDLWFNPTNGLTKRWNGNSWITLTDSELKEIAQSKAQIFTSTPTTPYYIGDLWTQGTSGDIFTCTTTRVTGDYVASDWTKSSKYTDDTKANESLDAANKAQLTADTAKGVAENAETIGNNLKTVLGYDGTKITGTYIYSPVISGGSILVGDKSGTYAEITPSGILNCAGANVTGAINASGGTITGNLKIKGGSLYAVDSDDSEKYRVTLRGVQSNVEYGVFYITDKSSGTATYPFRVNGDGSFSATKASIQGTITSSTITGSKIVSGTEGTSNSITLNNGYLYIGNPNGTHIGFANGGFGFTGASGGAGNLGTTGQGYGVMLSVSRGFTLYDSSPEATYTEKRVLAYNVPGYSDETTIIVNRDISGYAATFTDITGLGTLNVATAKAKTLTVSGTKSRVVETEDYDNRLLYCYETPSPMFGDIGEGQIDETGKCYIFLDDIFAETIDTDCQYQVFLQPYGQGKCYITERTSSYFIVEGTENLFFGWELKAIQRDYDAVRLETQEEETIDETGNILKETENYLDTLLYDVESEEQND